MMTGFTINNTPRPAVLAGSATLPTGANIGVTLGAGVPDYVSLSSVSGAARLGPDPLATGSSVWYFENAVTVPNGSSLTIDPYTVVKFGNTGSTVSWAGINVASGGSLDVNGSLGAEVVFTSIHDDYARGSYQDSNGNAGATTPAASNWQGIYYQAGSSGSMRYAHMSYAGYYYSPLRLYSSLLVSHVSISNSGGILVYVNGALANPALDNMTLTGGATGLYIVGSASGSYSNVTIDGATTQAIYISSASPTVLSGISISNTPRSVVLAGSATLPTGANIGMTLGAGVPNYVAFSSVSGAVTIGPDPLGSGNSTWYIGGTVTVPNGASLTIDPYTVVKFGHATASNNSAAGINVSSGGMLDVNGAPGAEVVFTSLHDDFARGYYEDTNVNGAATIPAMRNWGGIYYAPGSDGSMSYVNLSYAGYSSYYPIRIYSSPLVSHVSIDNSAGYLVYVYGATASPVLRNMILNGGTNGLYATNSASLSIRDSNIMNCSGSGIAYHSVAAYSFIERNLIRGNNFGITVGSNAASPLTVRNNLIVENSGGGVRLLENVAAVTGANVALQHNTIANNGGIGVSVAANASGSMSDNIIASNVGGDVSNLSSTLTEDYNLAVDGSLSAANDLNADPLFTANWYVQNTSPAIDADVRQTAFAVFGVNTYAEAASTDVNNLDLGYHHAAPAVAITGYATSSKVLSAGGGGQTQLIFRPLTASGSAGPGLTMSAIVFAGSVHAGESIASVRDLGDGSYEVIVNHGDFPGESASIKFTANGASSSAIPVLW
jgi:hypothetical protein